jgi:DNA-binding SARP family transcriptional activator
VGVEYRILGPLEVLVDGAPATLGGPRQRAVLALLLAQANETVPTERLIDRLWQEDPPETATNAVQGYVSQLRGACGREAIATRGAGYAVLVGGDELDLYRFERRVAAAEAALAGGDLAGARRDLSVALALWRGPALADLTALEAVRPIAARLDELRLVALERRIDADLEDGRAAEVAAELEPLIAEHPLRERLRALRMLALYRSGRQAEALESYRDARATLVEQVGIEPGPELRELEQAVLQHDPALAAGAGEASRAETQAPRTVLAAAFADAAMAVLAELGGILAQGQDRELMLAATVSRTSELSAATNRLHELGAPISARGVAVRSGAFTSVAPGSDLSRLAGEQDVDVVLVDAPDGLLEDPRVLTLLEDAACDVAVLVGKAPVGPGPVLVPFSGYEHDWAAVELGAWIARSLDRPLRLAGPSTGPSGRDASRMLASASVALQRALGLQPEPVILDPTPAALVAAAESAGIVAVGLTERWRREGLGPARTALATAAGAPTLLVRRGLRPGGLAARSDSTRFTWTIAA